MSEALFRQVVLRADESLDEAGPEINQWDFGKIADRVLSSIDSLVDGVGCTAAKVDLVEQGLNEIPNKSARLDLVHDDVFHPGEYFGVICARFLREGV